VLAGSKTPLRLYVFAPYAGANDLPVYFASRLDTGTDRGEIAGRAGQGTAPFLALNFGDVQWMLVAVPEQVASAAYASSTVALISGLLLSVTLASFIWAMRRDARNLGMINDKYAQQNLRFDAALST